MSINVARPIQYGLWTLALAATVVMLGGGCSTTSNGTDSTSPASMDGSTAPSPGGDAAVGALPTVGQCLEAMTKSASLSTRLPESVSCQTPHGGEIVAVYQLTAPAEAPYPAGSGSLRGFQADVERCVGTETELGDFGTFVGDNRIPVSASDTQATGVTQAWSISGVESAVFVPGPASWSGGQRWLVCAAVLNNSNVEAASYSGSVKGIRTEAGGLNEQFGWCKDQPDPARYRQFDAVSCLTKHNYEQLATFAAGATKAVFPGESALDQLAKRLCGPLSSTATGGRSDHPPVDLAMSWTFARSQVGSAGQCCRSPRSGRSGTCRGG